MGFVTAKRFTREDGMEGSSTWMTTAGETTGTERLQNRSGLGCCLRTPRYLGEEEVGEGDLPHLAGHPEGGHCYTLDRVSAV